MTKLLTLSIGDPKAATPVQNLPDPIQRLVSNSNILVITVQTIFNVLLFFGVLVALAFVIFSGYKYLVSQGDKQEIETARGALFNSIVGLIIMLTSFVVISILGDFFHVSTLQISLFK